MKPVKFLNLSACMIAGFLFVLFLVRCKEESLVYIQSTNVNITTFLDKNPDQFSMFRRIMEKGETDGFLQAYGKYTLFLPTNDGVTAYLKKINKGSVEDISAAEAKDLVKFHCIDDTIATGQFGDGKIKTITMYGQYLTTGASTTNGLTKLVINKQAAINTPNVRVGNGIIHIVDNVLIPAKLTLSQIIEANTDYSVFTEALKATGFYDSLNVLPANNTAAEKFQTVFAETNTVFKAAGFANYAALKARYSPGAGNPKSVTDSLHMFMAYHILSGAKYLADISTATALTTLAPAELIAVKFDDSKVVLNDVTFNSVYEPGALVDRPASDITAANGVLHVTAPYASTAGLTTGHFAIKVRKPSPVYWDVADFPEIRAQGGSFRVPGKIIYFPKLTATTTPIAGWDWPNREAATGTKYAPAYRTDYTGNALSVPKLFVNGDYMNLPLGVSTAANPNSQTNAWMQLRTPVIVKGRYKVWVCYCRIEQTGSWPTGRREQCQVTIDGNVMARPFDFSEPPPTGTMTELESQGWKYYISNPIVYNSTTYKYPFVSKLIGIVELKTTDVHSFRMDVIQGNGSTTFLDMVHFIPVDAPSQVLPRFRVDGSQDFTVIP